MEQLQAIAKDLAAAEAALQRQDIWACTRLAVLIENGQDLTYGPESLRNPPVLLGRAVGYGSSATGSPMTEGSACGNAGH